MRAAVAAQRVVPTAGQRLQIHYVGRLQSSGKEFDRNHGGYPFEFTLGQGKVIRGWEVAFAELAVGETAELTVRADYAYGDEGSEDDIAPGATLVFEVELVGVKDGPGASAGQRQTEDRLRLQELRASREEAERQRKADKEAKDKDKGNKQDAQAKLREKLANKSKKGKGNGKGNGKKK